MLCLLWWCVDCSFFVCSMPFSGFSISHPHHNNFHGNEQSRVQARGLHIVTNTEAECHCKWKMMSLAYLENVLRNCFPLLSKLFLHGDEEEADCRTQTPFSHSIKSSYRKWWYAPGWLAGWLDETTLNRKLSRKFIISIMIMSSNRFFFFLSSSPSFVCCPKPCKLPSESSSSNHQPIIQQSIHWTVPSHHL